MDNNVSFIELQQIVSICLDEILNLKQERQELQNKVQNLEKIMMQLLQSQKKLTDSVEDSFKNAEVNKFYIKKLLDNMKYEIHEDQVGEDVYSISFYDYETTIDGIVKEGKSLVRFGDGEFDLMSGEERQKFQHYDENLAEKLKSIITSKEENLMVAVADNYGSLEKYNDEGKLGIRMYMTPKTRLEHRKWLDLHRTYHNAYITRPYALFADNNTDAPAKRFLQLRKIWNNRNVIFIEGALTRLGVGNDLFDNAASIKRIEAPAINSYDKYDDILAAALKNATSNSLFLVALGPTAEVMVYDLFKRGYQAVDIGHVDLEYEWYLKGKGGRCEIKTKYNNEVYGGDQVIDVSDETYLKQIVARID